MKVNKVVLVVSLLTVFISGIFLGLNLKKARNLSFPTDSKPFSLPCQYKGKTYNPGDRFPAEDGCNTCFCQNGKIVCTEMGCE